MKLIMLTHGMSAMVDDEDYDRVSKFKWYAWHRRGHWYACSARQRKVVYMHRLILGDRCEGVDVDHKDRNGLNNQKNNLRLAPGGLNQLNTVKAKNNTSGFKGVSWSKQNRRWCAYIYDHGKHRFVGSSLDPMEAAKMYDGAITALHGEFARTNKMLGLL